MQVVSVEQIQKIEKSADAAGLSYEQMMENAGVGIAYWVADHLPLYNGVIGLVGSGNNGGDTLIALRTLSVMGVRTYAFLLKERGDDPLLVRYRERGGNILDLRDIKNLDYFESVLKPGSVLLDGILGTGFRLPLRGALAQLMTLVHKSLQNAPEVLKIAVDCPSGIDCDTGAVSNVIIPAQYTLTMAAVKKGLLLHPARSYVGGIQLIDIGIDARHIENLGPLPQVITGDLAIEYLPERPDMGHKGTFGTCQILAGSPQFVGAAFLVGKAAYRSGCGLVNMVTCPTVYDHLAGKLIEAVWTVLPESGGGYDPDRVQLLNDQFTRSDALVIGPGWGLSESNVEFLDHLLDRIPVDLPTLIDADGLKLLARLDQWWKRLPKGTILTPHPGEMAVLTGRSTGEIQSNRWEIAAEYAQKWGVQLILKGAMTVVASANGTVHISPFSEPALATAGSGDVLSGIIGGLLAQSLSAERASILGVWIHAQAGKIAKDNLGTDISVTAIDILDGISEAFACCV